MKRLLTAAAASVVALPLLLSAAPASAAVSPNALNCSGRISNGGHTASETCTGSYPGLSQFRIVVRFCNTANCSTATSAWKRFGQTASLTSGGYATLDNIVTQLR